MFLSIGLGLFVLIFGFKMTHASVQLEQWMWTLPAALVCFIAAFTPDFKLPNSVRRYAAFAFALTPIFFFIFGGVFFKPNQFVPPAVIYSEPLREWMITLGQALQYVAAVTAAMCLIAAHREKNRAAELFFQLTILTAGVIVLLVFHAEPRPWIDVFTVQEDAAQALIHGKNPYGVEYYNLYPKYLRDVLNPYGVIFVYMPGIIYLMAPFKALGLDTRLTLLLAHLLMAFAIHWLAVGAGLRRAHRYVPALFFLSIPFVPFMLSMAWNDVLTAVFIPFVALALQRKNRALFYVSMIGLLLIKQHIAVCFPLLFWVGYRELSLKFWRSLFIIGGSAFAACLPFLLWGWRDFLGNLWGLHFLKYNVPNPPERTDSYSFYYWIKEQLGFAPPGLIAVTSGLTLIASFYLWKKNPSTGCAMALCGLILMNTFTFAGTAFLNYYWVPIAFFIVALACLPKRSHFVSL